jgi:hypothetical protein
MWTVWCGHMQPEVSDNVLFILGYSGCFGAKKCNQYIDVIRPGLIWYSLVLVWYLVSVFMVWLVVFCVQSVHNIKLSLILITIQNPLLILRNKPRRSSGYLV